MANINHTVVPSPTQVLKALSISDLLLQFHRCALSAKIVFKDNEDKLFAVTGIGLNRSEVIILKGEPINLQPA
jgi:hypothetical protein